MDGDETERLLHRAQAGDVAAFEALIRAHLSMVRRFARAFADSDDDAADLAQEALVKVYRSIGSYRFQAAFSTWLYAVVRNVFLDAARGRAARARALAEVGTLMTSGASASGNAVPARGAMAAAGARALGAPVGDADGGDGGRVDHLFEREERRRQVWAALSHVPTDLRTTLVLFDLEGLTYDEVAAVEKVPLGTVKSRLSRGREHLRRALAAAGFGARTPAGPDTDAATTTAEARPLARAARRGAS